MSLEQMRGNVGNLLMSAGMDKVNAAANAEVIVSYVVGMTLLDVSQAVRQAAETINLDQRNVNAARRAGERRNGRKT